jgi:hypothetical protein
MSSTLRSWRSLSKRFVHIHYLGTQPLLLGKLDRLFGQDADGASRALQDCVAESSTEFFKLSVNGSEYRFGQMLAIRR